MVDDSGSSGGSHSGESRTETTDSRAGQIESSGESGDAVPEEPGEESVTNNNATDSFISTSVKRLLAGGVLVGAVLSAPAYLMAGYEALQGLALAVVLCVLPGVVTLCLTPLIPDRSMAFLLGSSLRMLFALGGAIVVRFVRPSFGLGEFYLWLILLYMFALAFETVVVFGRKVK